MLEKPIFYVDPLRLRIDALGVLIGAGAAGLESRLSTFYEQVRGTTQPVTVRAILKSSAATALVAESLDIVFNPDDTVTIGDRVVDLTTDIAAGAAISAATLATLAAFGIAAGPVGLVGLAVGGSIIYAKGIEPFADRFFDGLFDSIDYDVELLGDNNQVVAGALFKDGIFRDGIDNFTDARNALSLVLNQSGKSFRAADGGLEVFPTIEGIADFQFAPDERFSLPTLRAKVIEADFLQRFASEVNLSLNEVLNVATSNIEGKTVTNRDFIFEADGKNYISLFGESEQLALPAFSSTGDLSIVKRFASDNIFFTNERGQEIGGNKLFDSLIVGDARNNTLSGNSGNDYIIGAKGTDLITGGQGDDIIVGGSDIDTAVYSDIFENYDIRFSENGETVTITHARGGSIPPDLEGIITNIDGTDTLNKVEFGQFADRRVRLAQNTLTFVDDSLTARNSERLIVYQIQRTGDTSFPISYVVDGTVVRGGNREFVDFSGVLEAGENPTIGIGLLRENFDIDEDVDFSFKISISEDDPFFDLVRIIDNDAIGTFIADSQNNEPQPQEIRSGRVYNDPRLKTFDGAGYSFQAAGDFILARVTEGPEYEVQVRFGQISSAASNTEAMATSVDGLTVSIELDGGDGRLIIDGQNTSIESGRSVSVGSGSVSRMGSSYNIDHGNGDSTAVKVSKTFLNVTPSIDVSNNRGKIEGLLGNADGDSSNDFRLSDGTVLTSPLSNDVLYGDYARSWLVESSASILPGAAKPYAAPGSTLTLESLPSALRAEATRRVAEAGITDPFIRDTAILDFAITGNIEFIESARLVEDEITETIVSLDPISPSDSVTAITLTSDRTALIEEDADSRTATFTVARGSLQGNLTFNYTVSGAGVNPTSIDDFQDNVTSGLITIEDGTDTVTFDITVADDAIVEDIETFDVSISPEPTQLDNLELLTSSIRLTIKDNDEAALPPIFMPGEDGSRLTLANLDGSGTLTFSLDQVRVSNASEVTTFSVDGDGSMTELGMFSLLEAGQLADGFNPEFSLGVSSGDTLQFVMTGDDGSRRMAITSVDSSGTAFLDFSDGTQLSLALSAGASSPNLLIANSGEDGEAIDFTSQGETSQVEFTVYREAAFESTVGLYVVDDLTGAVTVDGMTFNVGDDGYADAALKRSIGIELKAGNGGISTFTADVDNLLYGTFIRVEETSSTYFSYLGVNSGNDHVKVLGNNVLGFEDLPRLGDSDYNDLVVAFDML